MNQELGRDNPFVNQESGARVILISLFSNLQCFGLRILSALLKRSGHQVKVVFLTGDSEQLFPDQTLIDLVDLAEGADLVGISLMTPHFKRAVKVTQKLREEISCPIIWGGIHPTIQPEECIEHADIICLGEGEQSLPELVERLNQKEDYSDIRGLWVKSPEGIVKNELRPLIQDLDSLPSQDFGYENSHYIYGDTKDRIRVLDEYHLKPFTRMYATMATRGCPYGCSYCVNFTFNKMFNNRKIRKRSIENILNELIEARKKMPYISHIYFLDDSLFLLSIEEISKLARGIKNEIGLPFGVCGATPATLKEEKLREIVDAGCNHISMGVQTGSARVMKMYLRPFSNEKILGAVKLLNQFRDKILAPQYDMILDNPWETEEDVIESLMLLSRFPVPYRLQLFSLTLYPGTGLSDKAKKEGMLKGVYEIDYSKNYREFWKNNLNSIFGLVSDCAVRGIKINPRIMAWLVSKKLRNLKLNWVIFYAIRLWVFIWKIANLPIGLWIVLREVFRDIAKGDWSRLKWFSRRERWRSIIHYVLDDRRKL